MAGGLRGWSRTKLVSNASVRRQQDRRGYGFIRTPDRNQNVFVHISEMIRSGIDMPEPGTMLSFSIGTGRDGRQVAVDIREVAA